VRQAVSDETDSSPFPPTIPPAPAVATWAFGWFVGLGVVSLIVLAAFGVEGDDYTIAELGLATLAGYVVFGAALWFTSNRHGSGDLAADYAVGFRSVDLVGLPVGALAQLLLIPALYAPLRAVWPDTFSQAELEERAQSLADKAGGFSTVLLVLLVVVAAPVVEEVVYRGLLQRSLRGRLGAAASFLVVAVLFTLVHLSPVEYPGLFAVALVFGAGVLVTGRLGWSLFAHAAFNLTGVVMVLR
jgi:membrane protease YdiL (CAAX protease family)